MTPEQIRWLLDSYSGPFFVAKDETNRRRVVIHAHASSKAKWPGYAEIAGAGRLLPGGPPGDKPRDQGVERQDGP